MNIRVGRGRWWIWRGGWTFRTKFQNIAKANYWWFKQYHVEYFTKTQFLKLSTWNKNTRNEIWRRFRSIRRRFWRRHSAQSRLIPRWNWRLLIWRKPLRRKSISIYRPQSVRVFPSPHSSLVNHLRRRLNSWGPPLASLQSAVQRVKKVGKAFSNICWVGW